MKYGHKITQDLLFNNVFFVFYHLIQSISKIPKIYKTGHHYLSLGQIKDYLLHYSCTDSR